MHLNCRPIRRLAHPQIQILEFPGGKEEHIICNCKVRRVRSVDKASFSYRALHPFDYEATESIYHLEDVYVCEKSAPGLSAALRMSHLYVTPREDSMSTFCLFFLTPLLFPSSLCPLILDSDLYTAAMFEVVVC
jgi:hypothetical protein